MKFGKRLGAEAERGWQGAFLDYKACKRAISKDVILEGVQSNSNGLFHVTDMIVVGSMRTWLAEWPLSDLSCRSTRYSL